MTATREPSLSVVIVAYDSGPELTRTLPALAGELLPGDEVIVVDNASAISPRPVVAEHLPEAKLVELEANLGFTGGSNRGAAEASGDILLLLNPDAVPEPGFGQAIRQPFRGRPDWAAWMALVTCRVDGRRVINSRANPVHFTGITWAGGYGEPIGSAGEPREIPVASGAALAVRREVWSQVGGFPPEFFLYQEDTDISIRIQSAGHRLGLQSDALVDHDYDFGSNDRKWFWLERNRLAMVIRNYPASLLLLLSPALLATELVLLLVSARQGWLGSKLAAYRDLLRWLPRLARERREVQAARRISPGEFAGLLTPDLDSPLIPAFARRGMVRVLLRTYWKLVRAALNRVRSSNS